MKVIRGVLDPDTLLALLPGLLSRFDSARSPRQSGMSLRATLDKGALFKALRPLKKLLTAEAEPTLGRSSFRAQPPSRERMLPAHQDYFAMGNQAGAIFWVPLSSIDLLTPTIALGNDPRVNLLHITLDSGYVVLKDQPDDLVPVTQLEVGDVVMITPTTVHATYIPEGALQTRYSLDVRYVY